jgi:repressor LexA
MTFLERLDKLCIEKNISKRKLEREAGLGTASTTKWKKDGSVPNQTSLEKLSEYLGVSVSYLIGESEYRTEQEAVIAGWNEKFNNSDLKEDIKKIESGVKIPVLGSVPCGIPIEAIELVDADDWEEIPERMSKQGKFFGLKLKGDSMSPRMMEDDVVIVRKQPVAESGDVVIVKVNGEEATCKKLVKHENGISLVPYNSMYEPMYFSNEDIISKPVTIIGKVVELRGKV